MVISNIQHSVFSLAYDVVLESKANKCKHILVISSFVLSKEKINILDLTYAFNKAHVKCDV